MDVVVSVPQDIGERLQERWGDLSRRALEAVVVDAYRDDALTLGEVRRLLGHATRLETEAFLNKRGAFLDYSDEELDRDAEAARRARSSSE